MCGWQECYRRHPDAEGAGAIEEGADAGAAKEEGARGRGNDGPKTLPKCPHCGTGLESLTCEETQECAVIVYNFTPSGEYERLYEDTFTTSEDKYRCPHCNAILAETEYDALLVLDPDREKEAEGDGE